jgi:hypothetical protein
MKTFKEVLKGQKFCYNGNTYKKVSSRTAILLSVNRVFYFSMNDNCTNVGML